jgi:hypothetical protein
MEKHLQTHNCAVDVLHLHVYSELHVVSGFDIEYNELEI